MRTCFIAGACKVKVAVVRAGIFCGGRGFPAKLKSTEVVAVSCLLLMLCVHKLPPSGLVPVQVRPQRDIQQIHLGGKKDRKKGPYMFKYATTPPFKYTSKPIRAPTHPYHKD